MDLITAIRAGHGVDESLRASASRITLGTIDHLKENLSRALTCLSEELYSKSTHFVLEFIQNAEDNTYAPGVTPELRLTLDSDSLLIECNETGFTAENVRALCQVGASTKKEQMGYIGEKGIGFKSVFKVADTVDIASGPYTFTFDKRRELGMITPIWRPYIPTKTGWTTFRLSLSSHTNYGALKSHVDDIKPSLMLFLRKLKVFRFTLHNGRALCVSRQELGNNEVALERKISGEPGTQSRYIISRCEAKTSRDDPKRPGISRSEVVLAFPISDDGKPLIHEQDVHSFLPIRSYGFSFVIQADLLTLSSREDLHIDSRWNLSLRKGVVDAFILAIDIFHTRSGLETAWLRYLPRNISHPFFKYIEDHIFLQLSLSPILKSSQNQFRLPTRLVILLEKYREVNSLTPLIPEACLMNDFEYLSLDYDVSRDGAVLRKLGARDMKISDIISGLNHPSFLLSNQTSEWHEKIAGILLNEANLKSLQLLRIIPLSSGVWANSTIPNLFYDKGASVIPRDLNLHLVYRPPDNGFRKQLFDRLGVKEVDPDKIAFLISERHRSRVHLSPGARHSHAIYLYAHGNFQHCPGFLFCDTNGKEKEADGLYMDDTASLPTHDGTSYSLREVVKGADFLHPIFTADVPLAGWRSWLKTTAGIRVAPRVTRGLLCPEFVNFLREHPTEVALHVLKFYWTSFARDLSPSGISQISNIYVEVTTGGTRMLKEVFLQVAELLPFPELPFVPLKNPEEFLFLREVGVTTTADGGFYLKLLIRLQQVGLQPGDEGRVLPQVINIYKQLDAQYDDRNNIHVIRATFRSHPLILCRSDPGSPLRWIPCTQAVWKGFPSMQSKIAVSTMFSAYENLFLRCLELPNAHERIMLDEVLHFASRHRSSSLDEIKHRRIQDILGDIESLIRLPDPHDLTWLTDLRNAEIFPAKFPTGTIRLSKLADIYIPDPTGQLAREFSRHVAFLHFDQDVSYHRIRQLLEHTTFKDITVTRRIENAVCISVDVDGGGVPDVKLSRRFTDRISLFARMVQNLVSPDAIMAKTLLPKLSQLEVIRVKAIRSRYVLGAFARTISTEVHLKEAEGAFVFTICESAQNALLDMCRILSQHLKIDYAMMFSIMQLGLPQGSVFLDHMNLPPLDVESQIRDVSWLKSPPSFVTRSPGSLSHSNDPSVEDYDFASHTANGAVWSSGEKLPAIQSWNPYQPTLLPAAGLSGRQPNGNMHWGGFPHNSYAMQPYHAHPWANYSGNYPDPNGVWPQLPQHPYSYPRHPALPLSPYLEPHSIRNMGWAPFGQVELASPLQLSDFRPTPSQVNVENSSRPHGTSLETPEAAIENGKLGELFVFNFLRLGLPDFSFENWTSELRGAEYPPYSGNSPSDFVYHDQSGGLTEHLFGKETREKWLGKYPRYFLEVKTTAMADNEPFHMSATQLMDAGRMTNPRGSQPNDVFVIVRVSKIRTETPSCQFFVDPHRCLYDTTMKVVSDVYISIV